MIKFYSCTIVILFFISFSFAQEKKEAASQHDVQLPQDSTKEKPNAPLPKIDLPEFVITGQEQIAAPQGTKESFDEEKIYAPEKPDAGTRQFSVGSEFEPKQTKSFTKQPDALNGKVFAGFGLYMTPMFDGWFGQHDQSNSYIINGYYQQSNGYVDYGDWWKGGFGAKGKYVLPDSSEFFPYMQTLGNIQYDRDAYKAFASPSPNRVRDLSTLDVSLGFGSRYALPYESFSGLDYIGTIGFNNFSAKDSLIFSENDIYFSGSATTQWENFSLRGQVDYRSTAYNLLLPHHNGQWFVLRVDGRTQLFPNFQFGFSLRQYLYRGNTSAGSGRLYPQIDMRYFAMEGISAFFQFTPNVQRNTLANTVQANKYIDFNAPIIHSDIPIEITTGMEARLAEQWGATAKFRYQYFKHDYLTFLDSNDAKLWEVVYLSGVHSTAVDVSVSYRPDYETTIKTYAKTTRIQQNDSLHIVPYIPAFNIGAVYYRSFDNGLNVEATAEFVGSRYTDFFNTHSNAGYFSAGAKADKMVIDRFRVYGEIGNLLSQNYYVWNGYRERRLYFMIGASYSW